MFSIVIPIYNEAQNITKLVEEIFQRDFPDHYLLAEDGMWFELPVGSDEINVTRP